ncbi:hypothetical protein H4R21_001854 [Coemansia helicoidea]|uniref:Uncharacterized protein n=1 Tax=Coemansia helicoidea TaxID=1286919 RepID=A0ACC1LA32_9FUNG|nr:hypothetical protein H4R21_001854 [Coemansia helicoidea]
MEFAGVWDAIDSPLLTSGVAVNEWVAALDVYGREQTIDLVAMRRLAHLMMLRTVSAPLVPIVLKNAGRPHVAWHQLREMWASTSEAGVIQLGREWGSLAIKQGKRMVDYTDRVRRPVDTSTLAGVVATERENIRGMLAGLGPQYKTISTILLRDPVATFESAVRDLLALFSTIGTRGVDTVLSITRWSKRLMAARSMVCSRP